MIYVIGYILMFPVAYVIIAKARMALFPDWEWDNLDTICCCIVTLVWVGAIFLVPLYYSCVWLTTLTKRILG